VRKGLLFAGSETSVWMSLDDGDHWQSLQLNLPHTSMRDLWIHNDDLIVATHGRSFWILDDITPLRQAAQAAKANAFWLYDPALAIRIDNDSFAGTPIPPEEPTAENPPSGAIIDYYLNSPAVLITLEIFDGQKRLVRKFSSEEKNAKDKHAAGHPSLPIAEHWFPKPQSLQQTPGLHRFLWNLTWGNSAETAGDEESEYRAPRGPKVVPGIYQLVLTVDGKTQSQSLKVVMDPRSPATTEILQQQFQLGQQAYAEALEARRALAEITSVQKKLADAAPKLTEQQATLKSALADAQSELTRILTGKPSSSESAGLQNANTELASALRVIESGDRAVPSQAIALYKESSHRVKDGIAEWTVFKRTKLPQLNEKLREASLAPISISEIVQEVEFLMSR